MFVVVDKDAEFTIRGFFGRADFHHKLGCGRFEFDPKEDLYAARVKKDPGMYAHGDPILRECRYTHRHAAVIMDAAWDGSPGAERIQERLEDYLRRAGWVREDCAAFVIDPELENWIWIPHDMVGQALGWESFGAIREFLSERGYWTEGDKPSLPKEALEETLKRKREPRSSKFYERILRQVPGVRSCEDSAFKRLRSTLQTWFPPEVP